MGEVGKALEDAVDHIGAEDDFDAVGTPLGDAQDRVDAVECFSVHKRRVIHCHPQSRHADHIVKYVLSSAYSCEYLLGCSLFIHGKPSMRFKIQ